MKGVWIRGGGNRNISCHERTREWIAEEIKGHRGGELGVWIPRKGLIILDI